MNIKFTKSAEATFKIRLLAFLAVLFSVLLTIGLVSGMFNEFASIEETLIISNNELWAETSFNFSEIAYNALSETANNFNKAHPQTVDEVNDFLKDVGLSFDTFSLCDNGLIILDKDSSRIGSAAPDFYDPGINVTYSDIDGSFAACLKTNYGMLCMKLDSSSFDTLMRLAANNLQIKHFWFDDGFAVFYDDNDNILYENYSSIIGKDTSELIAALDNIPEDDGTTVKLDDALLYVCITKFDDYTFCCGMNAYQGYKDVFSVYYIILISVLASSFLLYFVISILTKRLFVSPLNNVNNTLSSITEGNLDTTVESRDYKEFSLLSDNINSTVSKLKEYIQEAHDKNAQDLENARLVQSAALPSVSKVMSEQETFDLYASMVPAKEVGGDFYDFYLIKNMLYILIADVSGKGIPAALFMMNSKAVIKNLVESGKALDEVFYEANNILVDDSKSTFFVTAWLGRLNLTTGELSFVNAGHNPPLLKHAKGSYEYLNNFKPNLVLSGLRNHKYRINTISCDIGDKLYLYTDGVTEAVNSSNELYGDQRLQDLLNSLPDDTTSTQICSAVKSDVDAFMAGEPQFDDITMLSVRFFGVKKCDYQTTADLDETGNVIDFIESSLRQFECADSFIMPINLVCDEIFSNICNYAYREDIDEKPVSISLSYDFGSSMVTIVFSDYGQPFNPIKVNTPDFIGKKSIDRPIGGLGIHIVKSYVDDIYYEYKNSMNILTICKKETKHDH